MATLALEALDLVRAEEAVECCAGVPERRQRVLRRVLAVGCGRALRLFYHRANIGRSRLNYVNYWLRGVIYLDPLLAALHQELLVDIRLANEHLLVVGLHVADQLLVVLDDLLQLRHVQLLLPDARPQVIVLLGRLLSATDRLHALLEVAGKLAGFLPCLLRLLLPGVVAGSWLLPRLGLRRLDLFLSSCM